MVERYAAGDGAGEEDAGKAFVSLNWLLSEEHLDLETELAWGFLDYLLLGTSAAPLRKALNDSGLGEALIGARPSLLVSDPVALPCPVLLTKVLHISCVDTALCVDTCPVLLTEVQHVFQRLMLCCVWTPAWMPSWLLASAVCVPGGIRKVVRRLSVGRMCRWWPGR